MYVGVRVVSRLSLSTPAPSAHKYAHHLLRFPIYPLSTVPFGQLNAGWIPFSFLSLSFFSLSLFFFIHFHIRAAYAYSTWEARGAYTFLFLSSFHPTRILDCLFKMPPWMSYLTRGFSSSTTTHLSRNRDPIHQQQQQPLKQVGDYVLVKTIGRGSSGKHNKAP